MDKYIMILSERDALLLLLALNEAILLTKQLPALGLITTADAQHDITRFNRLIETIKRTIDE